GLANKELGRIDSAETDLNRSIELLPTAPAHFALGDIAATRGNSSAAIEHYKIVAKSGGEYGKAATAALAKLEMPSNPGAYIARACAADGAGKLVVTVRNDTTATITGVQVAVSYTDASGRSVQRRFSIPGEIAPGKLASVNTGMGPYTTGSTCPAEVVAGQIVDLT
ncbi:MAG: hypothetical protein OEY82_06940, partial [Gammaproteobacteria bacterium]|nr:hypothetical protein [Gammaproteobacteria bacterium]